jgi:hypothetical protein
MEGRRFRPTGRHGTARAERLVEEGMRQAPEGPQKGKAEGKAASPARKK